MPRVLCECGETFTAPDASIGGIVNCPSCGKANEVPGLNDPFWRMLQAAAVLGWVLATGFAVSTFGLGIGIVVGAVLAGVLFFLSRML